jgi:lactoylglutathione lyase
MKKSLLFLIAIPFLILSQKSYSQEKPKVLLNHIAVYVLDLKISTAFYKDIIGLDTIPEPFHDNRHTWFSVGVKSHLHIIFRRYCKNST